MARMLAQLGVVSVTANGLAPVLGGFLAAGFGWRSIFAAMLVAAAIVTFIVWRYFPETRSTVRTPPRAGGNGRGLPQACCASPCS